MFKGHFREYSIERVMEVLTSFDRDVEIVVRPHKKSGKAGRITFRVDKRRRNVFRSVLFAKVDAQVSAGDRPGFP